MNYLENKSRKIRRAIVDMVYHSGHGHIGGSLSCVDILIALYYGIIKYEDKFILSKGHAAPALYSILADQEILTAQDICSFCKKGGLEGHPNMKTRGITVSTGSLGNGLGIAAGLSMTTASNIYVLLSDGECMEGSTWEGVHFIAQHNLNNVIPIVDANGLTVTGEAMRPEAIGRIFTSFGWHVKYLNGHSFKELTTIKRLYIPTVYIAVTIKGKGIPFMENKPEWHHRIPTKEEYEQIAQG